MCGIAGFVLSPLDYADLDPSRIARMVRTMGLSIEHRGRDATGVVRVSASGRVKLSKAPVAAGQFFDSRPGIGEGARLALIHTRLATQGDPLVNRNNHPVQSGHIIGIHNGWVNNDKRLFAAKRWPQYAEVDSEAIFAALANVEDPKEALGLIEGHMATAWIDVREPLVLNMARGEGSPLCYAMSQNGSLMFGSTPGAVQAGLIYLNEPTDTKPEEAEEGFIGSYNGDTFDFLLWDKFEIPDTWGYTRRSYTSTYTAGGWSHDDDDWIEWNRGTTSATKPADEPKSVLANDKPISEDDLVVGNKIWFRPHKGDDGMRRDPLPGIITDVGRVLATVMISLDPYTVVDDVVVPIDRLSTRYIQCDGLDKVADLSRVITVDNYDAEQAADAAAITEHLQGLTHPDDAADDEIIVISDTLEPNDEEDLGAYFERRLELIEGGLLELPAGARE